MSNNASDIEAFENRPVFLKQKSGLWHVQIGQKILQARRMELVGWPQWHAYGVFETALSAKVLPAGQMPALRIVAAMPEPMFCFYVPESEPDTVETLDWLWREGLGGGALAVAQHFQILAGLLGAIFVQIWLHSGEIQILEPKRPPWTDVLPEDGRRMLIPLLTLHRQPGSVQLPAIGCFSSHERLEAKRHLLAWRDALAGAHNTAMAQWLDAMLATA